jgi:hypothetical protein
MRSRHPTGDVCAASWRHSIWASEVDRHIDAWPEGAIEALREIVAP